MIDVRHLRALLVLDEELHFGRAAQRLGMAQPHLSALVRKMEDDVGTPLFGRRPRVETTHAGQALIGAARRLLDDLDRSVQEARRIGRGEAGTVRVGFASTAMLTDIPRLLESFRTSHPEVKMELRELHSGAQAQELRRGGIDVSLTREARFEDGVTYRRMISEPFVAILPAAHPLAATTGVTMPALASEPLVLFRRAAAPTLYRQITALFVKAGLIADVAQEADEWHTVVALVAAGFGISLAPESVGRLASPGTVYRKIDGVEECAEMFLCWMPERLSPAAARLVKVLDRTTGP